MVELGEKGPNVVKNGFFWWKTRKCGEAFLGRKSLFQDLIVRLIILKMSSGSNLQLFHTLYIH